MFANVWVDVGMKHELRRDHAGKHEMGSITPTCSFGWRGRTHYARRRGTSFCALRMGRRFFGSELNPTYFRAMVGNLTSASSEGQQADMFSEMGL
jgi:hypothetical protein